MSVTCQSTIEFAHWGMHLARIPPEVGEALGPLKERRIMCRLNGAVEFHCALLPKPEWGYFINIGKRVFGPLGLRVGDTVSLELWPDHSEFKAVMPEELDEVLQTDEAALQAFEQLTPGRKRSLIYHVDRAKRTETRIERALRLADKLKLGVTDLHELLRP